MTWTVIPGASLVVARWLNGLGTSREIWTERGADGAMLWQVSIADLERDGPFSHYVGYDRVFTPIAGEPAPELAFEGGGFEVCPLLVPKAFPGDVPTLSRVPAPGRAFNAIVARGRFQVEVAPLRLAADEEVAAEGVTVVHCLSGAVLAGDSRLAAGDSAKGFGVMRAVEGTVALLVTIETV